MIAPSLKTDSDPEQLANYLGALARELAPQWDDPLLSDEDREAKADADLARRRAREEEVIGMKLDLMFKAGSKRPWPGLTRHGA